MVDEFLNDYEILGRKMRLKLEGETGTEKLDTFRRAIGQDERVRLQLPDDSDEGDLEEVEEAVKDRWDCETILSMYKQLFYGFHLFNVSSDLYERREPPPLDPCSNVKTRAKDYGRHKDWDAVCRRTNSKIFCQINHPEDADTV